MSCECFSRIKWPAKCEACCNFASANDIASRCLCLDTQNDTPALYLLTSFSTRFHPGSIKNDPLVRHYVRMRTRLNPTWTRSIAYTRWSDSNRFGKCLFRKNRLRNHCVFNWNVRFERHMYAYMCVHVYQIAPKNSQIGDGEGTTPS